MFQWGESSLSIWAPATTQEDFDGNQKLPQQEDQPWIFHAGGRIWNLEAISWNFGLRESIEAL